MADVTDMGAIARRLGIANPEDAAQHCRNALCLLGALRQEVTVLQNIVVGITGATANRPAISELFESLSRRLWRAVEDCEARPVDAERARSTGAL